MPVSTSIIEQRPLYNSLPAGQEIIFVISNDDAVTNETKVKFIVDVHISSTTPPDPNTTTDLQGTFKTTPNNAGVGIFDLRNIIENYVKADNMAAAASSYKGTITTPEERHPLHLIDKYSLNNNSMRYMVLQFAVEFLGADDGANQDDNVVRRQDGTEQNSETFSIFNGYLKHTDQLIIGTPANNNFGYPTYNFIPLNQFPEQPTRRLLTNAPATQYANLEDYGTMAFLAVNGDLKSIDLNYYDNTGSSIGSDAVTRDIGNGAYNAWDAEINKHLLFFGCFPANLQNWSAVFQGLVTAGTIQDGYIRLVGRDAGGDAVTQFYYIYLNCPNTKGYESIRLCWLNQWGAWDYYTFTKKSVKSIATQGTTYTQLEGTWNESLYRLDSFRGGKKTLRRNATESIKMNTGFVTEDDAVMFEELINSPEVYLLDGFQTDENFAALNQYVTPVRLKTSSFTRKTIANDRLMQYDFEVEKTKTLRTQSV